MSYRIEYHAAQKKHHPVFYWFRLPLLVMLFFLIFVLLVETSWPEGAALLGKTLIDPEGVIAVSALNEMADELYEGQTLVNAFADFCRKLVT